MSFFRRDQSEGQLFNDGYLHDHMRTRIDTLDREIQRIDPGKLLATEPSAWVEHFVSLYAADAPRIRHSDIYMAPAEEANIDVSNNPDFGLGLDGEPVIARGTRVTFRVPFDGDAALFHYCPSHSIQGPMRAAVEHGELAFTYLLTQGTDADEVKEKFERELVHISTVAVNVARDVAAWNAQLPTAVRDLVDRRRQKLLADHDLVDAFGYPVRKREGAQATFAVPTTRRRVLPPVPIPSTVGASAPDPTIPIETFGAILDVCRTMSLVMERSPKSFAGMGEEDLRTHFLVALNAQFEGAATGETFNCQGKTDILFRYGDRNIFIAECKFWKGPASLVGAIDQVLGYLAWRDTKAAILLFNRNKDFSSVVEQIGSVVRGHPNFLREAQGSGESEFRAVLHQQGDSQRELHLAVLAFDVPA